jgi:hypothetical protein
MQQADGKEVSVVDRVKLGACPRPQNHQTISTSLELSGGRPAAPLKAAGVTDNNCHVFRGMAQVIDILVVERH